ncbi:MAG: type II secretion system GspH family protein [Defluviitaleaceae bacterium]|nr:type II secretion system GspH family protein [Defluviitaleaceae bacterium]MCL2239063.1 type II secretion system GspH family protein [Defluviitaleaceae bacterium]
MKGAAIHPLTNRRGVTLMELIVSLVVISLIMIAVTTVFSPMLRAFQRNHALAEANTMLDNIAMLIMDDVNNAVDIQGAGGAMLITSNTHTVIYTIDGGGTRGHILRNGHRLFDAQYYRGNTLSFSWSTDTSGGVAIVTLTLTVYGAEEGWHRTRTYTARPLGMVSP